MEQIISSHAILFFLIYSLTILCFVQVSSNAGLVTKEADMLVKSSNLSLNSISIVQDKAMTMGITTSASRKFMFSGSSSSQPTVENLKRHSGYFTVENTHNARMFYFFFQSRGNRNDPVILWLTGGPGCSSTMALFYENGPFHINNDLSLKWNDFGWDKISNIIYIDQPIGTGYSYTSDDRDIRRNTNEISNDLYNFLQAFFQDHPKFMKNDFYIVGQSYAGHYIPVLASRLHEENKASEGIHINIKGFAIGNGFTDPVHMYSSLPYFALSNNVISTSEYNKLKKRIPECLKSIQHCQYDDNACADSFSKCHGIVERILRVTENINYYDIRKKCVGELCYDLSNLKNFLSLDSVRKAIGVGDGEFELCSHAVQKAMLDVDWMKNYDKFIPPLLEDGIKVFIFAGEYDLICNWLGISSWVNAMEWSGQRNFSRAELTPHIIEGQEVGLIKRFKPLTFLKVYDAGHMVPMDQPEVSLKMLQNWMEA